MLIPGARMLLLLAPVQTHTSQVGLYQCYLWISPHQHDQLVSPSIIEYPSIGMHWHGEGLGNTHIYRNIDGADSPLLFLSRSRDRIWHIRYPRESNQIQMFGCCLLESLLDLQLLVGASDQS